MSQIKKLSDGVYCKIIPLKGNRQGRLWVDWWGSSFILRQVKIVCFK